MRVEMVSRLNKKQCNRHWALVGHWHGSPCAILHGDYIPAFSCWFSISSEEWSELHKEGFYTRRQRSRPTAFVDKMDQNKVPIQYEWD